MLHKNAIKYVKQEYTLIFIYYVIRFGIIRFGSVRIPKLRYSVFRYFTRFGPPLKLITFSFMKNVLIFPENIQCKKYKLLEKSCYFKKNIYFLKNPILWRKDWGKSHVTQHPCKRILHFVHKLFNVDLQNLKNFLK